MFDKTGTLTLGKPRVVHVASALTADRSNSDHSPLIERQPQQKQQQEKAVASSVSSSAAFHRLLGLILLAESNSDHPIANAIVQYAKKVICIINQT